MNQVDTHDVSNSWQAEFFRLAIFNVPADSQEIERIWTLAIGEPPAKITVDRTLDVILAEGHSKEYSVSIESQGMVLNVFLRPLLEQHAADENADAPWNEILSNCRIFFEKFISMKFAPNRIAIGASLLQSVNNVEDGYSMIQSFLPYVKLDSSFSDFQLQLNRQYSYELEPNTSILINRLTNWSILEVNTETRNRLKRLRNLDSSTVCKLILDFNTQAAYPHNFAEHTQLSILSELCDQMVSVATKGL